MEETWDNAKKLIPKRIWVGQIYSMEGAYLALQPDSGYLTEILPLKQFPDYIDYLPKDAVIRKIGVMGYLPKAEYDEHPFIAISREEYREYIERTIDMVLHSFREKNLIGLLSLNR